MAAELQGAAAGKVHLEQALERALEEARGRVHEIQDARGQLWDMSTRLDETETALAALAEERAAEVVALTARVQTLTASEDQLREAHVAIGAECDRLAADLQGATAAKAHLEEALRAALEEGRARDQESLEHLEATRAQVWNMAARLAETEQRVVALGEERAAEVAAFTSRVESLEVEADRLRETEAAGGAERDRLAAALEGSAAAKVHLEETLKGVLEAARSREQEATALLQETRGKAWAAAVRMTEAEMTFRAICEERAEEVEALTARAQALTTDADRLRETASTAASERDHLAAELAGARAAHERLEETLAQTLAESREREEAVAVRLAEREREIESLKADHAAETAARAAEIARPAALRPAIPTTAPKPAPARPARSAGPAVAESSSPLVAVLDDEGAWSGITVENEVMILAPAEETVTRLASSWPGRMIVNLAAPGAMKAIISIRALGAPTRFWAYIANAADRALPLGAIEPAVLPLAPDAIVAALAPHAPACARVVTVGADVDALLSLRQALTRQGMSVSLAWDAKQATDLLDMVRPHVVVVDLAVPEDARAVLARLAASTPVPTTVLIEGTGDSAAAIKAALDNPDVASKVVSRKDVLDALLHPTGAGRPRGRGPSGADPAARDGDPRGASGTRHQPSRPALVHPTTSRRPS